jgi:hypothetical protein
LAFVQWCCPDGSVLEASICGSFCGLFPPCPAPRSYTSASRSHLNKNFELMSCGVRLWRQVHFAHGMDVNCAGRRVGCGRRS